MDKKLLDSLNNLSDALQQIADALKDRDGNKSATTTALQSGDFSKDLVSIAAGIKSIKEDTKEILKQQRTILSMSSKRDSKKDTDTFEKAGDKKSESNIKKGVGTILLIAVAVLAIGAAFKLVGNVNFLSVIGLSIAMVILAEAFSRVANAVRGMSLKEVLVTGIALVSISAAIMVSSIILQKVRPVGIPQILTTLLIGIMFAQLVPRLGPLFESLRGVGRISPIRLFLSMVAISGGIMASSKILAGVVPIGPAQAITGILIAAMFAVISFHFERLAAGFAILDKANVRKREILMFMTGVSAAITASSYILGAIRPIGFAQFITGIAIAAMFAVISFHFERLAIGMAVLKRMNVKPMTIILTLVGISTAIMASSHILAMTKPLGLAQFITALGIALLFGLMSYVMPMLAVGIVAMDRFLGAKKMLIVLPLVFIGISLAIMASSHILAMSKQMEYKQILNLAVFGLALAILVTAFMPAVLAVGIAVMTGVGALAILGGAAMIPVIATAIMISSHIIAAGNYDGPYPGFGWAAGVGLSMIEFSAVLIALGVIAITGVGALAILAGLALIPMVAQAIVDTSEIIRSGKYDKYPGPGWALTVAPLMIVFAAMVVALGVYGMLGPILHKGLEAIPWVAQSIVNTARVIGAGKYDKYPGPGWALTVAPLMLVFGAMVVALGAFGMLGPVLHKGLEAIPWVAQSIVSTSKIIARGKYDKYPGAEWALSVGALMTVFGLAVVTLGTYVVGTFGLGGLALNAGVKAVKLIARSIVSVAWIFSNSSAAFKKGPPKEWAEGVNLALGAFSPIYKILLLGGVMKAIFGTSVKPYEFAEAIRLISQGVVDAAKFFGSKEANVAFEGGPKKEWADGVGKAIGAFAPVYKMLVKGGIMEYFVGKGPSVETYVSAIKSISEGIVASAGIFSKANASFEGGYPKAEWGHGVGAAIAAFSPVLKMLTRGGLMEFFTGEGPGMDTYITAIKKISYAIVQVGYIFTKAKGVDWTAVPGKEWGTGIKSSIGDFLELAETVTDSTSDSRGWEVLTVANSMSAVARVLTKNRVFFAAEMKLDGFVTDVRGSLLKYMSLAYEVKKRTNAFWKDMGMGRDFMTSLAKSFVGFTKALARGRSSFDVAMDPNFMESIYGNVKYYVRILEMLQSQGGVSDKINEALLGTNPMKPIAEGMVMVANAFERVATSLARMSTVLNSLDDKKLQSVVGFGQKVMGAQPKGFLSSLSSTAGSLVSSAGGLVSGVMNKLTPNIKSGGGMRQVERGKYGTQTQQMDKLIDTMQMLLRDTKVFKNFVLQKMAEMEENSLGG